MAKGLKIADSVVPTLSDLSLNLARPTKETTDLKLRELIAEETRMVRGIFQCFENPGETVKICVKKYPERLGVPKFEKVMTDGQEYEVPLYVARHLNGIDISAGALAPADSGNKQIGTCSYVVHGFKWPKDQAAPTGRSDQGIPVPIVGIQKRVKRYGFQSLEFAGTVT